MLFCGNNNFPVFIIVFFYFKTFQSRKLLLYIFSIVLQIKKKVVFPFFFIIFSVNTLLYAEESFFMSLNLSKFIFFLHKAEINLIQNFKFNIQHFIY